MFLASSLLVYCFERLLDHRTFFLILLIQFIKDYGIENAREVVSGAPEWASDYCTDCKDYVNYDDSCYDGFSECESCVSVNNLKRLVGSVELVEVCGGLVEAKKKMNSESLRSATIEHVLYKAIADYESIYSIPQSVKRAILNLEMHL